MTYRYIFAAALCCTIAACTEMSDFYPDGTVVEVEGHEYLVRPLSGRNSWQAMENKPTLDQSIAGVDPNIYRRATLAIEKATGCTVDRTTIQNSRNNTIAATIC